MALVYRLNKLSLITEWQYRTFCIQLNRAHGSSEPEGLPPERSSVWQMVLRDLWKRGTTKSHVAAQLHVPHDEVENLLFGLTGDTELPSRPKAGSI